MALDRAAKIRSASPLPSILCFNAAPDGLIVVADMRQHAGFYRGLAPLPSPKSKEDFYEVADLDFDEAARATATMVAAMPSFAEEARDTSFAGVANLDFDELARDLTFMATKHISFEEKARTLSFSKVKGLHFSAETKSSDFDEPERDTGTDYSEDN